MDTETALKPEPVFAVSAVSAPYPYPGRFPGRTQAEACEGFFRAWTGRLRVVPAADPGHALALASVTAVRDSYCLDRLAVAWLTIQLGPRQFRARIEGLGGERITARVRGHRVELWRGLILHDQPVVADAP